VAAIVCACAVPHIMAAARPRVIPAFFTNDWRFPQGISEQDTEQEYAQNTYYAWQKMPLMLARPMLDGVTASQAVLATCFLTALLMLLHTCRLALPSRRCAAATESTEAAQSTPPLVKEPTR
jgi:hypothetical protein